MRLRQWLFQLFAQTVPPRDLFIPGRHPCRAYARRELVQNLAICPLMKAGSHCRGQPGGSRTFYLRTFLKPSVLLAFLLLLANAVQVSVAVGLVGHGRWHGASILGADSHGAAGQASRIEASTLGRPQKRRRLFELR